MAASRRFVAASRFVAAAAAGRFLEIWTLSSPSAHIQSNEGAHSPREDLRLVAAARSGDQQAADTVADRFACVWRILAVRNARSGSKLDRDELANVAQDVLLALWKKLDRFDGTCTLETWAYAFCQLTLQNARRKAHRHQQQATSELVVQDELAQSREPNPQARLNEEGLYRCLETLEPSQRELVLRKTFENTSFAQIAMDVRESPNTLKSRYHRAIECLRKCLRAHGEEDV